MNHGITNQYKDASYFLLEQESNSKTHVTL